MKKHALETLVLLLKEEFDSEVFEHIIHRFMPLFKKVSQSYKVLNYDFEDYIQEGQIVMIEAIELFNPEKQDYFSPFFKALYKNRIYNLYRDERAYKRGGGIREVPLQYHHSIEDEQFSLLDVLENFQEVPASKLAELNEANRLFRSKLSKLELEVFNYYMWGKHRLEVARLLNIQERQVQSAFERCRLKLKKVLELE